MLAAFTYKLNTLRVRHLINVISECLTGTADNSKRKSQTIFAVLITASSFLPVLSIAELADSTAENVKPVTSPATGLQKTQITLGDDDAITRSPLSAYLTKKGNGIKRRMFRDALSALEKKNYKTFRKFRSQLSDYPLYPYLEYRYLADHPEKISAAQLVRFEKELSSNRMARYLRKIRLKRLLSQNKLEQLVREYQASAATTEIDCAYVDQMLRINRFDEVKEKTLSLWNSARSMPQRCDTAFQFLIDNNLISEKIARERYIASRSAGKTNLSNYLFRFLSESDQANAKLLEWIDKQALKVTNKKEELLIALKRPSAGDWVDSYFTATKPFYRASPDSAAKFLSRMLDSNTERTQSIDTFVAKSKDFLLTREALADLESYPKLYKKLEEPRSEVALEWQARSLIQSAQWKKLRQLLQNFPSELQLLERWRYWSLRARQISGSLSPEDLEALELLAQTPSFYGFAASHALERPFTINAHLEDQTAQQQTLLENFAIRRAIEFYLQGLYSPAAAEWQDALKEMSKTQTIAAAYLAGELGWHHQAIATAAKAKIWLHYSIRFPHYYDQGFAAQARRHQVPYEWLYATARQESALNPNARSSANARGLMQLLPATAKETAKRIGKQYELVLLNDPGYNIELGSAYLSGMYYRYGNKALASAAYNAGPHRVDRWLKNLKRDIPLDAWIETIRFNETRQYVQNILSFGLIKKALTLSENQQRSPQLSDFDFFADSEIIVKTYKRQVNESTRY